MEQLSYNDFFNFNDSTPIDQAIKQIERLENVYKTMIATVEAQNKTVAKEFDSVRKNAEKMAKSIEGLNVSMDSGQKSIEESTKATAALVVQNEKLTKTQQANEKQMKDLNNEVDKLANAKDQLKKANEAEAGSIEDVRKQLRAAEKEYKSLGAATDEATKQESLNRVKQLSKEYNNLNDSLKTARKSADIAAGSYNELNKFVLEGRKRLKQMEGGLEGNSEEFNKLQKEVAEGIEKLKQWDKAIGDNFRNVGNYESALNGLGGALQDAVGNFQGGAVSAGGLGNALGGIVSSIPIPQVAAIGAGVAAVGASMDALLDIAAETNEELRQTSNVMGLVGDDLENVSAGIRATAATFEKDFSEVLRSTNVLTKEFGLEGAQALDVINQGFLRGADANGDFLDQISEYSTQFKAAGLSAQDLVNIVTTSTQQGIFSDKGADTIKEAGLRLREMTKATSDALEPLGKLRVEQIQAAIDGGNTFEAIQLVSKGLDDVNLSAQQTQTIIADVFGGAGEDAGLAFIKTLSGVATGAEAAAMELTEYQKAQLNLLEAEQELARAETELGQVLGGASEGFAELGLRIKTFFLDIFLEFLKSLKPVRDAFGELFTALGRIGDAFARFANIGGESISVTQLIGKWFTWLATPLRWAAQFLGFVVDAIADFIESSPVLQKVIETIGSGFKNLGTFIENIPALLNGLLFAFREAVLGMQNLTINTFKNIGDIIKAAFDPTVSIGAQIEKAKKSFTDYGSNVADAFRKGFMMTKQKEAEEIAKADAEQAEKQKDEAAKAAAELAKEKAARTKAENDKANKAADDAAKRLLELQKKRAAATLDLYRLEQNEIIRIQNEIADNERKTLEERTAAAQAANKAKLDLLEAEKMFALSNAELIAEEREVIEREYALKAEEINRELADNLKAITEEISQAQFERGQIEVDTSQLNELRELNEAFQAGEIESLEEYEKQKQMIQEESNRTLLENQLTYLEQQAQLLKDAGADTTDIENQIAKVRLDLSEKTTAELIADQEKLNESLRSLGQASFDSALSIIDSRAQAEDERRALELERLEEQQEREIELAGDNQQAKEQIFEEFAARKAAIEAEQAKADRRRAIFEKTLAATQIAVDTSRAVIKAVAASPLTGGLPFSAIVGAIGAVQLAAVLAKPIPQFAEGTQNAPRGLAIINELGQEIIEDRTGKKRIINTDGATLTYLKGGEKIHTAEESQRMIESENFKLAGEVYNQGAETVHQTIISENSKIVADRINAKLEELKTTISGKKEFNLNITRQGVDLLVKRGQNWTKFVDENYK